jgi:hypothetical protein
MSALRLTAGLVPVSFLLSVKALRLGGMHTGGHRVRNQYRGVRRRLHEGEAPCQPVPSWSGFSGTLLINCLRG